jgi:Holliday junction resolvasome RuvABC endonuclease subunit
VSGFVVGIDPSLTKTGIGRVHDDGTAAGVQLSHLRPVEKAKRAKHGLPATPTLKERSQCLRVAAEHVVQMARGATLAVVYDPPAGAKMMGPARLDVPGHWWAVIAGLQAEGIPIARTMDVSARKAITGPRPKGESRETVKVQTALAIQKLYPDVEIVSDDVSDALAAAHLGAVALGWGVPTLARHSDVKWSEFPALESAAAA